MLTYNILPGTTDVSVVIRIVDSTDGTPETGVVWNTSGIDLQYRRELAASTAITEATLAALTTAHTDGGFLHIGNGYYRLDLPDAACATGVAGVLVHGTVTGMVVIGCYIQLEGFVNSVYTRIGAPAGASVSADIAAVKSDSAAILVDTGTTLDGRIPAALVGGRMDASVGAMAANVLTAAATAADFGAEMATAIWTDTTAGDFTVAASIGKTIVNGVSLGTGLTINAYTGNTAQTGDAFARLGAPAGASVSADVAAVKSDSAAIKTKTDQLTFTTANQVDATTVTNSDKTGYALTADIRIKKNTALANFVFLMVDTSDAPVTGATVTPQRSLDGAALAAMANSVVEISNGLYKINLAAADTNADTCCYRFTAAGCKDRVVFFATQTE